MSHGADRSRRIAEVVRRAMASILREELSDAENTMWSVTGVNVSKDLRNATVFVSSLAERSESDAVVDELNRSSPFFRHRLSQEVKLKRTPELHFRYDTSIEHGVELTRLIDSVSRHDPDTE
jgi:ribosome-binding factor A